MEKNVKQYSFFIFGTSEKARELAVMLASGGHLVTLAQHYIEGTYDAVIYPEKNAVDTDLPNEKK